MSVSETRKSRSRALQHNALRAWLTADVGHKMTHFTTRAFQPRPLTEMESAFTRQLIEHADVGDEERKKYLAQLEAATVVRKCECGCASIDFAISGIPSEAGAGLLPFADFV